MDENVLKKIIDLLYTSVISEGGDGDAYWYSRFESIENVKKLIEEYNEEKKTGWIIDDKEGDNYITWKPNDEYAEEWIIITDNETVFNNAPSYIILKVKY